MTNRSRYYCSTACYLEYNSTPVGTCWRWTGLIDPTTGRGALTWRRQRMILCQFVALAGDVKISPDEMPHQTCGDQHCCNPAHCAPRPRLHPSTKKKG